ncbi:MAG: GNAT family N-acetyltransferase [Sphingobacteriaceae bacterium]|nr:MAG: GNAT family N-acetyltransferase [Sphingobacteriaceae bacterium]
MLVSIQQITAEQTWPMRQTVMYPQFSIEQVKLEDDAAGRHFGLFLAEELTVVVSVFVQNEAMQFRKLATKTDQQGKGYGRQMMQFIIELASAENLKTIWCNARLSAENFYKQFGFEVFGETWQQNGHDFVVMRKQILGR